MRRLAGSSAIEAARMGSVFPPVPSCPRAPRNAQLPPTIAQSPLRTAAGEPGVAPPLIPRATMVPMGVPSLFRISKIFCRIEGWAVSAMAPPGAGAGLVMMVCARAAYRPLAGWPLTATMSAKRYSTKKFLGRTEGVTLGLLAYLEISEMSVWYITKFSVSMVRITDAGVCPWARLQYVAAHRIQAANALMF